MITALVAALDFLTGIAVPDTVYWLTGLIDGLAFLPLLTLFVVPIAGRISREKVGRLHYLQSVAPLEAVALVLTATGYEFAPIRKNAHGVEVARLRDGTQLGLDDDKTWYRLGNRRFAVTYVPDEKVLTFAVDSDDWEVDTLRYETDSGEVAEVPAMSGERAVLTKKRGGFQFYTPWPDGVDDGYLISLSRAINSLRGGGGVRLSEHTERMTRMQYGGGASISNKARVMGFIGVIFIGSVLGVLIFGVL